jgi:hypothetical protein
MSGGCFCADRIAVPVFLLALPCVMAIGCAYNAGTDIIMGQLFERVFNEGLLTRPKRHDKSTWVRYLAFMLHIVATVSHTGVVGL